MRDVFSPLGACQHFTPTQCGGVFTTRTASVEIRALADDVIRVTMRPPSAAGASGATAPAADRLPPSVAVVNPDWPAPAVEHCATAHAITLSTAAAAVTVDKRQLRLAFTRPDGSPITIDTPARGMGWMGAPAPDAPQPSAAGCFKSFAPDTHFYGFGQRTGHLDKRGTAMTLWNTDVVPHSPGTDAMYVSIPFFIALSGGSAYGVFMDSTSRCTFNMGERPPVPAATGMDVAVPTWPDVGHGEYWFGTARPELDYYFFAGPTVADVVRAFSDLTGRMQLPPLWALGYHQSRFSYCPESQVRAVARSMRDADIPCDAIYLDIDYMDGFRVFTFDPAHFPDPAGLISDLRADGFNVVAIVDPGVKIDSAYPVYRTGRRRRAFVRRAAAGATAAAAQPYRGRVWPGAVVYPDFARADARAWWARNHATLFDAGVRGIWNDMNEPSNFATTTKTLDEDAVHGEPGAEARHAHIHNAYGNLMCRSTQEAFAHLLPDVRPFVITRAGSAGIQRDACVWTGDNSSWWEHLAMSIPMCCNMSLSGVSFTGADVGGFLHDASPELVTRWVQAGAFMPLFRNHSVVGSAAQEPYALGEPYTSICRKFIKLRYRLLPYLYTLMRDSASAGGAPVMRPMVYEFPHDPATHVLHDQFMLGPALMVAPVVTPGATVRQVYFPRGRWLRLMRNDVVDSAGEHRLVECALDETAVYLREGHILPWGREMSYVGQREQALERIDVFPGAAAESSLAVYVDDGESLHYRRGAFGFIDISCCAGDGGDQGASAATGAATAAGAAGNRALSISINARDEAYPCALEVGSVKVLGLDASAPPPHVFLGGAPLPQAAFDRGAGGVLTIRVNAPARKIELEITP